MKIKNMSSYFKVLILVLIVTGFLNGNASAQISSVDPAFDPSLTKDVTSSFTGDFTRQPDGKIIVFGTFQSGGTYLKRFNTNGTQDFSFNGSITETINIYSALALPDGKIMVAGFTDVPKLYRLNPDGSIDPTFNVSFPDGNLVNVTDLEVLTFQPDGKILVRRKSLSQFGDTLQEIFRLNPDGSNDDAFTRLGYGPFSSTQAVYSRVLVLPDGKLLVGRTIVGFSPIASLRRHNSDGTVDSTFEIPNFGSTDNTLSYFDVNPDGSIIVSGRFNTVNSIAKRDLVRLLPAGNVDLGFFPDSLFDSNQISGGRVEILPSGQFLLNTIESTSSSAVSHKLLRFNSNGSLDNTYNQPLALTLITKWILDGADRALIFGTLSGITRYLRLNADPTLDSTYNPIINKKGIVSALAVQADGKVLISGDFDRIGGVLKNRFGRVNSDGTLDISFGGTGFDIAPTILAVQADGKILAAGNFSVYNEVPRTRIVRINTDGSLDEPFNPIPSSSINAVAPLANGKILIGGNFLTVNGISQPRLAQLNSDGSLDTLFSPILSAGTGVNSIFVQSDGKIMIGGAFSGVNGFTRQSLARLNSDGTLDATFNAGSIAAVTQVFQQSNGKYVFRQISAILRRNNDGTADTSFQSPAFNGTVNTIFLQADGNILVGGSFSSPKQNLARFSPNGILDSSFIPAGANASVYAFTAQPNGKILVGGNFVTIGGASRSGIARITFTTRSFFDFDGDGKADVSVFRPSENKWYVLRSSDMAVTQQIFAIAGDIPVPADYDGDGKTDFAIFRPSNGDWWSLSSLNGNQVAANWGQSGDIPRPSDFDGDGRADYIVFRPSNSSWYRGSSANGSGSIQNFGLAGDKPVTGDFDGDGKSDKAIFRPSTGDWWWQSSLDNAQRATHWGADTDIPAQADFDGDGKTDFAVYRPSTGVWYVVNSGNGSFTILSFGIAEDKPVPADYDGDGKADIAVFRPSNGAWYLLRSTDGFFALSFGVSTDVPVPNAFVP